MTTLLTKVIADFSTTTTAKWSVGATSGTLTSGLDADGIQLPTGTYGFTIDRKNSSKEYFTATLTGANLTSIKSVTRGTGIGTAGLVREHRKGAEVIISDYVAIKRMMDVFDGSTAFDADVPLTYDGAPTFTDGNSLVTKDYADAIAVAGGADASTTTKGISKMSYAPVSAGTPIAVGDNDPRVPTQGENDALAGTSGTPSSSNKYVTNDDTSTTGSGSKIPRGAGGKIDPSWINQLPGGDGSDGALTISSGTTTIDLGGASIVVKNYTSISITGTGKLAFSNPHANGTIIIIRSQGNVTLTSSSTPMLDGSGLGGAGGTAATTSTHQSLPGVAGTIGKGFINSSGPGGAAAAGGGGGGTAGAIATYLYTTRSIFSNYFEGFVGAGGGSGGTNGGSGAGTTTSGAGGRGGGMIIVECSGAWNFTTAGGISVAGANGSNGTTSSSDDGAGGGGGGGGGYFLAVYNTLTANSGTVTVAGGTGGNRSANTGSVSGAGGGANALSAGVAGTVSSTANAKTGGDGATGESLIVAVS